MDTQPEFQSDKERAITDIFLEEGIAETDAEDLGLEAGGAEDEIIADALLSGQYSDEELEESGLFSTGASRSAKAAEDAVEAPDAPNQEAAEPLPTPEEVRATNYNEVNAILGLEDQRLVSQQTIDDTSAQLNEELSFYSREYAEGRLEAEAYADMLERSQKIQLNIKEATLNLREATFQQQQQQQQHLQQFNSAVEANNPEWKDISKRREILEANMVYLKQVKGMSDAEILSIGQSGNISVFNMIDTERRAHTKKSQEKKRNQIASRIKKQKKKRSASNVNGSSSGMSVSNRSNEIDAVSELLMGL